MFLTHKDVLLLGELSMRWVLARKITLAATFFMLPLATFCPREQALKTQTLFFQYFKSLGGFHSCKLTTDKILNELHTLRTNSLSMTSFTTNMAKTTTRIVVGTV